MSLLAIGIFLLMNVALDASAVASPAITTYAGAQLPGRLLVNSVTGDAYVVDLRTGERLLLPRLSRGRHASQDQWRAGYGPLLLRWYSNVTSSGKVPLFIFDSRSWTEVAELKIGSEFRAPQLSPDGRYILTFWKNNASREGPDDRQLTIFDVRSGMPIKRGSRLDGKTMIGSPAAWLPDGRYVYRAGPKIYLSSPSDKMEHLVSTLPLKNHNESSVAGGSLAVSPDGTKLAFTLSESRGYTQDTHIWVSNLDGSGMHRLTSPPNPKSPLRFKFGNPTWSPDGKWVAGVLHMAGTATAPVFPADDTVAPASQVVDSTGCGNSPVFVVPVQAENVAISWPAHDARHGVKVKAPSGRGAQWLSSCESVEWLP